MTRTFMLSLAFVLGIAVSGAVPAGAASAAAGGAAPVIVPAAAAADGLQQRSINVGGDTRSYYLFAPAAKKGQALPLVIALVTAAIYVDRLTTHGEEVLSLLSSAHREQLRRIGPELHRLLQGLGRGDTADA